VAKRKQKRKKVKLSPAERLAQKIKRDHFREVRKIFESTGFARASKIVGREFSYAGSTSDFDEVFLRDNILVLIELTTLRDGISEHLKKKNYLYEKIQENTSAFITFLDNEFPEFRKLRATKYRPEHFQISIVYASLNNVERTWKDDVPNVVYLDLPFVKYLCRITSLIKLSARFELFKFLNIEYDKIGEHIFSSALDEQSYKGSILPETQSHFGAGYKVVSFYVDPEALIERCYVLRKDGWREESNLYQRMIQKNKIESIRNYLRTENRVFINNIIVTLPNSTKLNDYEGSPIRLQQLTKTEPVQIELPKEYNSVGLIDGQHRVFSYYEGGQYEDEISVLRKQQNLLVTGIVYPSHLTSIEKTQFEAKLFLEINSTQTNPKSDLKQIVESLLRPFSPESIARKVVNRLNTSGALAGQFEIYFFDKKKLKTTSVVSYGVRQIIKLQGSDSLFKAWKHAQKADLEAGDNENLLAEYVNFCASEISKFISAVKANVPPERWTTDTKIRGRMLTTTHVNGFIVCLRKIIENDRLHAFDYYREKLSEVQTFSFSSYRSSHYGAMGEAMFKKYFEK
jgi:DGQHR domain-containing protein